MIAEPGETPTLPLITDEPVLVTVEPPRTAKLAAVPKGGAIALGRADTLNVMPANKSEIIRMIEIDRTVSLRMLFALPPKLSNQVLENDQ